jgi:NAD(P)-dependent dehydrogenase (short-subunit alcohol dehydrogenase family)
MNARSRLLEHRSALITGASRGLGFEIAKQYLEAGASVAICARDPRRLEQSSMELEKLVVPGQALLALPADVSKAADVERLVDAAFTQFGRLDILVNNAGVIGPAGAVESVELEAWVRALEINLMGAVLLSRAVLPRFKKAGRGKIIQLSGGGATNPLPHLSAYAASKAAVVRFVETLAEETRSHRIDVNALAPGLLNTRMLDEMLAAGPEKIGAALHGRLRREKEEGATPLRKGAELAVFLGSAGSDGITGKLISATWDPWSTLAAHLSDLNGTDVYTLRRILPKDRGLGWGEAD